MAAYTFGTVPVYDPITDTVVENATGGHLVAVKDGTPIPIYDLNNTPISTITSNGNGQSSQFKADVMYGLVQFGDLVVTVWANEVAGILVSVVGAITTANAAQATASTAATSAATSAAAAAAAELAAETAVANSTTPTWDTVTGKPTTFTPTGHTHPATEISDASTVGRNVLTAADAQAARAAIGAGTGNGSSNLVLGSDGVTAAAGNHTHAATGITFTPAGGVTATNVQTAIEQAAASGGGGGTSSVYVWRYASGGYPALPATLPTGVLLVEAFGPVQPSSVPSWIGDVAGKALLRYEYAALT